MPKVSQRIILLQTYTHVRERERGGRVGVALPVLIRLYFLYRQHANCSVYPRFEKKEKKICRLPTATHRRSTIVWLGIAETRQQLILRAKYAVLLLCRILYFFLWMWQTCAFLWLSVDVDIVIVMTQASMKLKCSFLWYRATNRMRNYCVSVFILEKIRTWFNFERRCYFSTKEEKKIGQNEMIQAFSFWTSCVYILFTAEFTEVYHKYKQCHIKQIETAVEPILVVRP